ncbi:MAG: nucleotidyltransferase domain-containing protein [bacterium]
MDEKIMERIRLISERLKKEYKAEKVILFGSYAKGEQTKDSDVDLFIIAPTQERFYERMASVLGLVRDLYGGLALSPIVLKPEEVAKRLKIKDQFVEGIVKEGIEL